MGVAPSLYQVYDEAIKWFQMYIDKDTYVADYQMLDRDADGGVTFADVQDWVSREASQHPDSCWTILNRSGTVLMMAHKAAAMHMDSSSSVSAKKVVDITEFRALLIHLYADSMLWRHFAAAAHVEGRHDSELYRAKLDVDGFVKACRSLSAAHAREKLDRESLYSDFQRINSNMDGLVGFVQLCAVCAKYIHVPHKNENGETHKHMANNHVDIKNKASRVLGCSVSQESGKAGMIHNVAGELRKEKNFFAGLSANEKTLIAMDQLKNKISREDVAVSKYHEDLHMREILGDETFASEEDAGPSLDAESKLSPNYIHSASELASYKE